MADPIIEGFIVDALNRVETKVDTGFTLVNEKLENKADKGDLREIRGEMRGLDSRVKNLEEDRHGNEIAKRTHEEHNSKFLTKRGRIWAAIYAGCSITALVFGPDIAHVIWH